MKIYRLILILHPDYCKRKRLYNSKPITFLETQYVTHTHAQIHIKNMLKLFTVKYIQQHATQPYKRMPHVRNVSLKQPQKASCYTYWKKHDQL